MVGKRACPPDRQLELQKNPARPDQYRIGADAGVVRSGIKRQMFEAECLPSAALALENYTAPVDLQPQFVAREDKICSFPTGKKLCTTSQCPLFLMFIFNFEASRLQRMVQIKISSQAVK